MGLAASHVCQRCATTRASPARGLHKTFCTSGRFICVTHSNGGRAGGSRWGQTLHSWWASHDRGCSRGSRGPPFKAYAAGHAEESTVLASLLRPVPHLPLTAALFTPSPAGRGGISVGCLRWQLARWWPPPSGTSLGRRDGDGCGSLDVAVAMGGCDCRMSRFQY